MSLTITSFVQHDNLPKISLKKLPDKMIRQTKQIDLKFGNSSQFPLHVDKSAVENVLNLVEDALQGTPQSRTKPSINFSVPRIGVCLPHP